MGIAQAKSLLQSLFSSTASAELHQPLAASLLPGLQGTISTSDGPLTSWLMALWAIPSFAQTWFYATARLSLALWVFAGLFCLWQASHRLTRRREARPDDPLGIGPTAPALAKTIADCAVLLAIACLGALSRWHEAGPHAAHFCISAGLLWAMAVAPEQPRKAGFWIGILLALGFLNEGLKFLIPAALGLGLALTFIAPWRLVALSLLSPAAVSFSVILGAWLLICLATGQQAPLETWWAHQFRFQTRPLSYGPETWAWTWWPIWPVLLTLIVQAWRHGLWRLFHLQMVSLMFLPWLFTYGLGLFDANPARLLPVAFLSCLAAFGLLSLPRTVTNLIDWFAVVVFTALGVFIWLYWSAIQFGFPEKLATRLDFLAPGVIGDAGLLEVLFGVTVSGAWLSLVIWRIGRGEARLWRPVVLSAGGLALSWVLLMNLLLPAIEINRGYAAVAKTIHQTMQIQTPATGLTEAHDCIQVPMQDSLSRALVLAHLTTPLAKPTYGKCHWRLSSSSFIPPGWQTVLSSPRNPNRPERTRFYLQARETQGS